MKGDFKKERIIFEIWYNKQFPDCEELLTFNNVDGYTDETISAMFVGFCSALYLKTEVSKQANSMEKKINNA